MKDMIQNFLSRTALSREPSPIRVINDHLLSLPTDNDILFLASGIPAPVTFPIESMSIKLKSGETLKVK